MALRARLGALRRWSRPAPGPADQASSAVVSGYESVRAVLSNPVAYSSSILADVDQSIVSLDPPEHDTPRRAVRSVLSPERVEALGARARDVARALLGAHRDATEIDLMAVLATPLPEATMAHALGVPAEAAERFARACRGDQPEASLPSIREALESLPAPPALLAELTAAHGLEEDHARGLLAMLWLAGTITTRRAIASAVLLLGRQPALRERVAADRRLVGGLVDEAIRLDPPEPLLLRSAGSAMVTVDIAAANRDETRFTRPGEADPERPPRHLSFGAGIHRCPGAQLARAETAAAVEALLDLMPAFVLAEPENALRFGGPSGKALDRLLVIPAP